MPLVPLALVASLASLVPLASAQAVFVVDDDPGAGVTHSTIAAALAVAGPLDRVDVRPGTYGRFDLVRPTRLMGEAGVVVTGESRIINLPASSTTVVTDLELERLIMSTCAGTVLLDALTVTAGHSSFRAAACDDVRVRALVAAPPLATGPALVEISASRVQFDDCLIQAGPESDRDNGQHGLTAVNSSFVHFTGTTVTGGRGGDYTDPAAPGQAGLGGNGLSVNSSDIRLVGSTVMGGGGGLDLTQPFGDAPNGTGFRSCGGLHDRWDTMISGGNEPMNSNAQGPVENFTCGAAYNGGATLPGFYLTGTTFLPGSPVTMTMRSGAGGQLTIILGRIPVSIPVMGSRIPLLVQRARSAPLGTVPISGEITIPFAVPGPLTRGTVMFLQTERDSAINGLEMSNATAIIVR
ncbi:hypothetical protein [Planctomycetes bacterium Poly30]